MSRKKNGNGYWTTFALAASATIALLYAGKKLSGGTP
jgi:hypothetical protein